MKKPAPKTKFSLTLMNRDPGLIHGCRKAALDAGNAVLYVYGGDVQVVAGLEGDGDRAGAAVGARGVDVAHPLDAVDRLLKRDGYGLLHRIGIGAHIICGNRDLRWRQRGVQGDGKIGDADGAGQYDEQCANGGEDRPAYKEIDKQSKPSFPRLTAGAYCSIF